MTADKTRLMPSSSSRGRALLNRRDIKETVHQLRPVDVVHRAGGDPGQPAGQVGHDANEHPALDDLREVMLHGADKRQQAEEREEGHRHDQQRLHEQGLLPAKRDVVHRRVHRQGHRQVQDPRDHREQQDRPDVWQLRTQQSKEPLVGLRMPMPMPMPMAVPMPPGSQGRYRQLRVNHQEFRRLPRIRQSQSLRQRTSPQGLPARMPTLTADSRVKDATPGKHDPVARRRHRHERVAGAGLPNRVRQRHAHHHATHPAGLGRHRELLEATRRVGVGRRPRTGRMPGGLHGLQRTEREPQQARQLFQGTGHRLRRRRSLRAVA